MIGKTLHHYRIESKLGQGGMGVVYKARDEHLDRPVAIKVLTPEAVADPERKRRFVQEAKAASALNHPNIVHVYDIDTQEGINFIAMEYVEGKTLDQLIGRRGLKAGEALKYAVQAADALAAAHAAGIVHRDVKPGNLMVTEKGLVKVLDFGLAKLSEPEESEYFGSTKTMGPHTEEGAIVGTVAYMSPEQAEGKKVDSRSDIFSFGSLLYEMLSAKRAFQKETRIATLSAILHQEPKPLGEVAEAVPQELDRIIAQCLRKDPGRRFQHMEDLRIQLEQLKEDLESGKLTAGPIPAAAARRKPWPVAIAAALLVLLAVAGLIWWRNRPASAPRTPALTRLTSDSGLTTDPALSPDGKLIAYASDRSGEGSLDIWRQQLDTGEAIRLTADPSDESEPDFSPDGSRIAFRSERDGGGIYVVSAFGGGEPRLIARHGRRPRFSSDAKHIAYWVGWGAMGKVFVAPSAGGSLSAVQPDFDSARDPIWSPDGKHILFMGSHTPNEGRPDPFDWWVAPRDGGPAVKTEASSILGRHRLSDGRPSRVAPAAWVGDQVFFSAQRDDITNLWRLSVSPATRKAAGSPEQLTFGTSIERKPSVISGGRIAFASLTQNLNIWGVPIEANRGRVKGEAQRLTHGAFDAHTSLSADGRKLVFTSTRSGNSDVWVKDLATSKETALTATPAREEQSEMTADGARICYMVVEAPQQTAIYEVNTNGGVPEKICDVCGRPWDWSPDGSRILFLPFWPHPRMTLYILDVATRQKTAYLEHPRYGLARARFSPDGRWIGLVAISGAPFDQPIMIVPLDGRAAPQQDQWISVTDEKTLHDKPRWSPDGNLLYYTSHRDGYRCIRAQRLDPKTKRPVGPPKDVYHSHSARRSLMNPDIRFMEISLSSDRMVFNLGEVTGNIWMAKLEDQD